MLSGMSDDYVDKVVLWGELLAALDACNETRWDGFPPESYVFRLSDACEAMREFYGPGCMCHAFYNVRTGEYTYRFKIVRIPDVR